MLLLLLPGIAAAQSLESRVHAKQDAVVRLSYASRPGVCGSGEGNINMSDGNDERDGWTSDCERGPVRVAITVSQGSVTRKSAAFTSDGERTSSGKSGRDKARAARELTASPSGFSRPMKYQEGVIACPTVIR